MPELGFDVTAESASDIFGHVKGVRGPQEARPREPPPSRLSSGRRGAKQRVWGGKPPKMREGRRKNYSLFLKGYDEGGEKVGHEGLGMEMALCFVSPVSVTFHRQTSIRFARDGGV